jgi:hypothetical protein
MKESKDEVSAIEGISADTQYELPHCIRLSTMLVDLHIPVQTPVKICF